MLFVCVFTRGVDEYVVLVGGHNRGPLITILISLWNVLEAPHRANGILLNWNKPILGPGEKAVFFWTSWFTGTCQYLLCKSNLVKTVSPDSLSCTSSFSGGG